MSESNRQKLNELNRELMVAEADCVELEEKVKKINRGISQLKNEIKDLLNVKENEDD